MAAAAAKPPGGRAAPSEFPDRIKIEDEVKEVEMEGRLRVMVMDLVRPTVQRTTQLQATCKELHELFEAQEALVHRISAESQLSKQRSEMVLMFNGQLEDFSSRLRDLDARVMGYEKSALERVEGLEQKSEMQSLLNERGDRTLDRLRHDLDTLSHGVSVLSQRTEQGLSANRDYIASEVDAVKLSIKDLEVQLDRLGKEIWGPPDPDELSPPSLRRLDMQIKKSMNLLSVALSDLVHLRQLDVDLEGVKKQQAHEEAQLKDLFGNTKVLRDRIERIAVEVKNDTKLAANRMAAFTATLMQDVRGSFHTEVKTLSQMQRDVEQFVRETQALTANLDQSVASMSRQIEASVRELRIDFDGLEGRRKRDKQTLQEGVQSLQGRIGAALDAAQATLQGLEHVSNVMSMALQSERMSVALDLQDYLERKDTPYVGVRGTIADRTGSRGRGARSTEARRKEGLDPALLMRLTYQPQPVLFQGKNFDRPQMLALREKIVHVAQEVLLKGPSKGGKGMLLESSFAGDPAAPIVAQALGLSDMSCAGRRPPMPSMARPGSRGQPSARGSPMLEGDFHRLAAASPDVRERGTAQTPEDGAYGTHLPSLTGSTPDGEKLPQPQPPPPHTAR